MNNNHLPADSLSQDGYIINQDKLTEIPYGSHMSNLNGCGWIAVYNLFHLFRISVPADEIRRYLLRHSLWRGNMGTNVFGVRSFLKKNGFALRHTWRVSRFAHVAKKTGAGIIFYLDEDYFHYVFYRREDTRYHFYNAEYGESNDLRTMEEFAKSIRWKMGHLIAVERI